MTEEKKKTKRLTTKESRKYIAYSTTEIFQEFHEDDMTIEQFQEYMIKKYKTTKSGTPISNPYIHTLLSYGHLPKHMGGNKLFISSVRSIIAIRVLKDKHEFNKNSGKAKSGQRKRGVKKQKDKLLF